MELKAIADKLSAEHPGALLPVDDEAEHILVAADKWIEIAQLLRNDATLNFDSMMCITGLDKGPDEVLWAAYNLHSMELGHKLEVRIEVPRTAAKIPSVANIWRAADWHEREAYDLIGIEFTGHPDFRRILLPDDWIGHPLRKDYVTPDYYKGMPVPKDKRGWE
ncbi:NADH-quinone oxidoreductase subunit C [Candidatus Neomarinimicrobiota bacterium]